MSLSINQILGINAFFNELGFKYSFLRKTLEEIRQDVHSRMNIPVGIIAVYHELFSNRKDNWEFTQQQIKSIKYLLLDDAELTEINFLKEYQNLEMIDCSGHNQIDSLRPLSGLSKLKRIRFSSDYHEGNLIADLRSLSTLYMLEELDLANNKVEDLSPIENLRKLRYLDLSNNNVFDVRPIKSLTSLQDLKITGNRITTEDLIELATELPECNITASVNSESEEMRLTNIVKCFKIGEFNHCLGYNLKYEQYNTPDSTQFAVSLFLRCLDVQLFLDKVGSGEERENRLLDIARPIIVEELKKHVCLMENHVNLKFTAIEESTFKVECFYDISLLYQSNESFDSENSPFWMQGNS